MAKGTLRESRSDGLPLEQTARAVFASNLRLLRRARGLSQEKLSQMAGLSRAYVGRVESGTENPGLDSIERLAHELGVTVPAILTPAPVRAP
jgi:transcriptional regulator with XRE-family HTH domain